MKYNRYIILGAASEVGMAYLEALEGKKQYCQVIVQYRTGEHKILALQERCQFIEIIPVKCDFAEEEQILQLIEQIKSIGVPTHILHCAAPELTYKRLKELDWNQIVQNMNIQLGSIIHICKAFLPAMAKQHYGKVVLMLSSCTIGVPPKYMTEYTVVKYALLGFMKSIASEYAGKGITINGISPSMMRTKLLIHIDERMIDMLEEKHPMKRLLTVEEVTKTVDFLLSEQSEFMTGENVNISGGQVM